ncbi:MAG: hypothetical protein ACR2RL_03265, partial [Gammaproteobacteria bacterium]
AKLQAAVRDAISCRRPAAGGHPSSTDSDRDSMAGAGKARDTGHDREALGRHYAGIAERMENRTAIGRVKALQPPAVARPPSTETAGTQEEA